MYVLKVKSRNREELVEFTDLVREKLKESGQREGVVVLYVQHTTAGLTINENADPDVPRGMAWAFVTAKRIPTRTSRRVSPVPQSRFLFTMDNYCSVAGREFFCASSMVVVSGR
jgi:hypothetical protein